MTTSETRAAGAAHAHGLDPCDDLPERAGPRPRTTPTNPQYQLEQVPETPLSDALFERLVDLERVELRESLRSPPGTIGFFLADADGTPEEAFLLGTEFAHVHVTEEHGLHLICPEPARTSAIARGWIEPHPLAGRPTVSALTVLAYAPRDPAELDVIERLVRLAHRHALGAGGAGREADVATGETTRA